MCIATLATLALACLVASTSAAPTHEVPSFDLADVMEKSVCPIEIRIDEDENRIPRRIKMLECARTPNPMCRREKMTHACCRTHHLKYTTQCVQVTDHVLVRYRGPGAGAGAGAGDAGPLRKLEVAVGCSCMIHESTPAVAAQ